jgi:hypothetical protein
VFESLVAIAFQIAFHLEIYKNNIFLFKKIISDISTQKNKAKRKIIFFYFFSKVFLTLKNKRDFKLFKTLCFKTLKISFIHC